MEDLSEKEQIEQFRAWWSEYGSYIIAGVVVAVVGMFGWDYYNDSKLEAQQAASALYDTLTGHVADGELEEAETVAAEIAGQTSCKNKFYK